MPTSDQDKIEKYATYLRDIGALSRLFSESDKPYINSRTAEYLYCKIFEAENLSRSDVAIDAFKDALGIGVKTFVYSGRPTYQKVAEFNRALSIHSTLRGLEKIKVISEMRNERLRFVDSAYGVNVLKYHCILRDKNRIIVYEEDMEPVDIENILLISDTTSSMRYTDGINRYSFSNSKSTLLKEFSPENIILETDVNILDDPFELVGKLSDEIFTEPAYTPYKRIILPMYSYEQNSPHVFPSSGLNQWNAEGRPRSYDEVYIPIPASIRRRFPDFLPPRDEPFELVLPNKEALSAKVSQAGGKALMSNPNSALGEWLLRDVLGLEEGELLTYKKLAELGIDSVEISKKNNKYFANFLPLGSYEEFIND